MNPQEFISRADETLGKVARWLEGLDPDEVDYSTGDGLVTLEFADGDKFILSRQSATNQLWFAASARAWHYNWDVARGAWIDDKDGHQLSGRVAEVVSEKIGHREEF